MRIKAAVAALSLMSAALWSAPATAACETVTHLAQEFTVCTARAGSDMRLFLNGPDGAPLGSFAAVNTALAAQGQRLAFAMNAGMYHADRAPVGLYVEDGTEMARIVTREGPGNFGLLPNGVFCIASNRLAVIESRAYAADPPACRYATQSGPMLVIDGQLHPRLLPGSDSYNYRNGVGVSADGQTAWFAISNGRVNFHDFATLFRDRLGAVDALYLDGSVSRLYAPELGRDDFGQPMGPIVGLVLPN